MPTYEEELLALRLSNEGRERFGDEVWFQTVAWLDTHRGFVGAAIDVVIEVVAPSKKHAECADFMYSMLLEVSNRKGTIARNGRELVVKIDPAV